MIISKKWKKTDFYDFGWGFIWYLVGVVERKLLTPRSLIYCIENHSSLQEQFIFGTVTHN